MPELTSKPSALKILLVDDSPTDRAVFRRFLTQHKAVEYFFAEAETIRQGLDLLKNNKFDCILLDYDLPDGIGTNFIEKVCAEYGKNTIPLVMLSGSGTIEIALETIRGGAQDFLVKSRATAADLVRAVENAIDKVRLFQDKILSAEKIQVSEERYRLLFENIPLPAFVYDRLTQDIYAVNKYAVEHYGYERQEFLTMTFAGLDFSYGETYGPSVEPADGSPTDAVVEYSARHRLKDGTIIDVEIDRHEIVFQNRPSSFVIVRDVTQRRQAEEERRMRLLREQELREAAESANRVKDEFLAVLSHELRTPLNAMSGWARILIRGGLDESKRQKALAVIERNINLQSSLIDDLLDTSRIISGKIRLEQGEVDFCKLVSDAVETARFAAAAKQIRLEQIVRTERCRGTGDVFRIQQVIGNLLTNAIKFTPEGGTVTLELDVEENTVHITVKDTGIGIDPDLLPFIFERFKQADGSTKRKFGGLGLGLAIAKSLVEMHDGRISAASGGPGNGSQFTVSMPFSIEAGPVPDAAGTGGPDRSEESNTLANIKIVLVDDETDSLDLLNFVLAGHGAAVHTFQSGPEALAGIEEIDPHILITDISMPEMDGFELIGRVRRLPSAKQHFLPAIAMTAYASAEDSAAVFSAGFQMHIPKPVDIETIAEKIRRLLESIQI